MKSIARFSLSLKKSGINKAIYMNPNLYSLIEEINDHMMTDRKPDKFIYRTELFEILYKHFGKKPQHTQIKQ